VTTGIIFDIKEFAVHDGPGMRTTVFLKGCPLACQWCHNPEGQSRRPQVITGLAGDRLAGVEYSPEALAALLNRHGPILRGGEGGVTFSGGEPLMQAPFLAEVAALLDDLHLLLDTSGSAPEEDLRRVLVWMDLVYFDLKIVDPALHRRYTGQSNERILSNLRVVSASGVPFVVRIPLVPGVTDTPENLAALAKTICGLPGLARVDLLPYNRAAGAKYEAAEKRFQPEYDENRPVNADCGMFERMGLKVRVA
jgi:pyruvate formate lyase activating enzyme